MPAPTPRPDRLWDGNGGRGDGGGGMRVKAFVVTRNDAIIAKPNKLDD